MDLRLGKKDYVHDDRTAKMADFLVPKQFQIPNVWDLDKGRAKMPLGLWGNDEWGDCVAVGKANNLVRLQRLDTHSTVPVGTGMVLDYYKSKTGAKEPGDDHDTGMEVIVSLRDWRAGWKLPVGRTGATYAIDAFGLLSPNDHEMQTAAAFLLGGIQFGLSLPLSAADQIRRGQEWDANGQSVNTSDEPGSWGGHLVYAKKFDSGGFWCITWGQEQYMTNAFIAKYADEVWAPVDKFDNHKRYVDQTKFVQYLRDIGASNIDQVAK